MFFYFPGRHLIDHRSLEHDTLERRKVQIFRNISLALIRIDNLRVSGECNKVPKKRRGLADINLNITSFILALLSSL